MVAKLGDERLQRLFYSNVFLPTNIDNSKDFLSCSNPFILFITQQTSSVLSDNLSFVTVRKLISYFCFPNL